MQIIIILLLAGLLSIFGMRSVTVETTDEIEDMNIEVTEVTEDAEVTDVVSDNPLADKSYDLVIDGEGLNMTFNSDGTVTTADNIGFVGEYEITEPLLFVTISSPVNNESIDLELSYNDLTLDVVSGYVYSYTMSSENLSEHEVIEKNAALTGVAYTLELTKGGQ